MFSVRRGIAYLWITIDPATALLNPRSMKQCQEIVEVIENHAEEEWGYDDMEDE
jgi:hypothetical protein